ncbi:MAG: undecaprenyldiphospho-muramoylpentapeptide beta-N-acetylglucosaminyltransferase [Clostridia bacterium]|nr:undecaprenyldiphospho-muramoylpentapeptide beta-N-acetylglucosaminyltransferase [Clostridia bacterium]
MRVLVSGGGTAGHINPALSIADKIKSVYNDAVIEYVGTPNGMENALAMEAGYKIHHIAVRGFKRKLSFSNVDAAVKAVTSVIKAKKIIKEFNPDIVIGTGGYVSWPLVKAASKMKIKTAIHEQNAVPGVTTKMLSKYVDKIMISFESSRAFLNCDESKIIFVGNPVSEKMLKADKKTSRAKLGISPDKTVILSAGGSLGAKMVNAAAYELIKDYSLKNENIIHFHATGRGGYEEQAILYKELGFAEMSDDTLIKDSVTVKKYIYNMDEMLSAADIVVCRAGAMTLSEIACLGKAAVIIPSPNVTNNHQFKNTKVLVDGEAAVCIEEKDLTGEKLIQEVSKYADNREYRAKTEENIKKFAVYDTLERIIGVVKELTAKKD